MKRLWCFSSGASCAMLLAGLVMLAVLSACTPLPPSSVSALERSNDSTAENPAVAKATRDQTPNQTLQQTPVERVPFVLGVSSVTVERMALRAACTGGPGAGLLTPPGPVEVYRMTCDDGKTFMARCELRQCTPM
jgi:hypothetical protein